MRVPSIEGLERHSLPPAPEVRGSTIEKLEN